MFKKLKASYRFLSRKFLAQTKIKKIIGINLVVTGLLLASFSASVEAFGNRQTLKNLSTREFAAPEITTLKGAQFPLKVFAISQVFSSFHPGIDFSAPDKTPVYPIEDGVVKEINRLFFDYGHYLLVNHGQSLESLYAHLSSFEVKVGDKVAKETIIGRVGTTGRATGPHLHLEIWQEGKALNPLEVLGEK